MRNLEIQTATAAVEDVRAMCASLGRRLASDTGNVCPVEFMAAVLRMFHSRSCGKCVPCRIGLGTLVELLEKILDGKGTKADLAQVEKTCKTVAMASDCAIGSEAARALQVMLPAFREEFEAHLDGRCTASFQPVPCAGGCPAHVDIPGYIALTQAGSYADAVRLIRKDNPFPSVCGLICEHPCEEHCRRQMVDDAINIRGLKRFAVERAGVVPPPAPLPATGKRVAVIGAGPAGLTAAYFLTLMGHSVTVLEKRRKAGGMLRYGIPCYRLPDEDLDRDIDAILATGVTLKTETPIEDGDAFQRLRTEYDSVFIAIGAHTDKKLGMPNEDKKGVMSAVELLRHIGDGGTLDLTGKQVVVVGGGNVAMDATRTAKRLGAESVKCVYRRRVEDMTALPEEVESAAAEDCEIMTLMAPVRVEVDEDENVTGLWVQPQIIGGVQRGRPAPRNADKPEVLVPADIIIVAIGQAVESDPFEAAGLPVKRSLLTADMACQVPGQKGVFVGGDCQYGPATVIRSIEAGKVAAANIDHYLGYDTQLDLAVDVPPAAFQISGPCGRATMTEEASRVRRSSFALAERGLSEEEAAQECSRCLRCDHFGRGAFRNGRVEKW